MTREQVEKLHAAIVEYVDEACRIPLPADRAKLLKAMTETLVSPEPPKRRQSTIVVRPATAAPSSPALPMAMTAQQAADMLGISKAQLWKLRGQGKIPAPVYMGTACPRWRREDLEQWIAAGCPGATTDKPDPLT